jgi:gliding motility-associated-like protein
MKKKLTFFLVFTLLFFTNTLILGQNAAPILIATGNQTFCPGTPIKIVTSMTITDPDDIGIDAIYVQISSGYSVGEDLLTLTGIHPSIVSTWNATTGTLSLTGVSGQPTYVELVAAIKEIEFSSSAINPSGIRNFSIAVGQANYLPSNGHYYLYVPNVGISWSNARIAAQASTYYGLQGYLATLTSAEEAQIAGEQTTGAGWIGGSDEANEGVWRWMTGPEAGTVFWNGNISGFSPNFAFWNSGEPNNSNDEDYAHITAVGVGILGSWNDLTNVGEASGVYQPKGYIVEYGGTPGDPVLQIATSTTLLIPSIQPIATYGVCENDIVTLNAAAINGVVNWYANPSGGLPLAIGNQFTTPNLSNTTIYYLDAFEAGCTTGARVPLTVNSIEKPLLTVTSPISFCESASGVLSASTTAGTVNWFTNFTDNSPIATGTTFTLPQLLTSINYYVQANNNNCLSPREQVSIIVNPKPVLLNDVQLDICQGDTVNLNADSIEPSYLWSTGETTEQIAVSSQGQFSVQVTNSFNCSATRFFDVTVNATPVISEIITNQSNATIVTTNEGDFQFSINGIDYQNSNSFQNLQGGNYVGYVFETNGCGFDEKPFFVISYPDFFTPNGDGYNDTWTVRGVFNVSNAEVSIFDRFGKLIAILNAANPDWDGTLNGQFLPSTDYWFIAKIDNNTPSKKGHFTLKR